MPQYHKTPRDLSIEREEHVIEAMLKNAEAATAAAAAAAAAAGEQKPAAQ